VPLVATVFGLRREHVLVEILAALPNHSAELEEQRHSSWVERALRAFDKMALPGGYPNLLPRDAQERAAKSYSDIERLIKAKREYDPDNVFRSAIPLPVHRSAER
jgi:FAD/FMN-containing dehydrogenase